MRQRLLKENRITRYLIYAFGEIILVVIRILIALQINNWNIDHSERQLERSILSEMKENLQFDLRDIRGNINRDSTSKSSTLTVLNQHENNLPFHDSLKVVYGVSRI